MKVTLFIIAFFLNPLFPDGPTRIMPPGRYVLQYDKGSDAAQDACFTLEYDRFIMKFADHQENLEVQWLDADSFIVIGLTESADPKQFEIEMLKNYRPSFNIVRQAQGEYHFVLGSEIKKDTISTGKFTVLR